MTAKSLVQGLHHVTIVSGDPQNTINFYRGILGMTLIKKTVNYDNSGIYHFYFGTDGGAAGSLISSLPYGPDIRISRHGHGQIATTALSLSLPAIDYWLERLNRLGIQHKQPQEVFKGEWTVYMEDFDGMGLELVFSTDDDRPDASQGHIPSGYGIRGLHHAEIWLESPVKTLALLENGLGLSVIKEATNRTRLGTTDKPGHYVDVVTTSNILPAIPGRGYTHHLSWCVPDAESLEVLRKKLAGMGLSPSFVQDKKYYSTFEFKDANGIIFEISTAGPGLGAPEPGRLDLPQHLELTRGFIERTLPAIDTSLQPS